MNIVILGATGNVGQRLVDEALRRGITTTAVGRKASAVQPRAGVTVVTADIFDGDKGTATLKGHDCTIVSLRFNGLDFEKLLSMLESAKSKRVIFVGGAASLLTDKDEVLLDTPGFPEFIKPEAEPARQALNRLKQEKDLDWTFISPSIMFAAGERTGKFRLGKDHVLTAPDGKSHISYEDFAIATLDEVEHPAHRRERFTVGY